MLVSSSITDMPTSPCSSRLLAQPILPLLLVCAAPCSFVLSASVITRLPGFQGLLPFHLETGYVTVDEAKGVELFYYFMKSERNPDEDPVMLWLSGGPGCSSLSGWAFGIGPLTFVVSSYNGSLPSLTSEPYSWTKTTNIIFLDSPVGAGFSFSRDPQGYDVGDSSCSSQAHKFLLKWFIDHPQFLSNPFYVGGDSYAGKVVPIITHIVAEGIELGMQPLLNLKGYVVGNPTTYEMDYYNYRVPYALGMGIISYDLFELIQRNCKGEDYMNLSSEECATNINIFNKFLSEIDQGNILDPKCPRDSQEENAMTENRRYLQEDYMGLLKPPPFPDLKCRNYATFLSYYWANDNVTREGLHVKKGTVGEWVRCNYSMSYTRDVKSSVSYHLNITSRGFRALVYSGDHDIVVPFLGTRAWIKSLNFSVVDEWRSWHVGGQVAGYTTTYSNNLTFATVKGGGHTPAASKHEECFAMFQRWISHEPL